MASDAECAGKTRRDAKARKHSPSGSDRERPWNCLKPKVGCLELRQRRGRRARAVPGYGTRPRRRVNLAAPGSARRWRAILGGPPESSHRSRARGRPCAVNAPLPPPSARQPKLSPIRPARPRVHSPHVANPARPACPHPPHLPPRRRRRARAARARITPAAPLRRREDASDSPRALHLHAARCSPPNFFPTETGRDYALTP